MNIRGRQNARRTNVLRAFHFHRQCAFVAVAQCGFKTFRQPLFNVGFYFHAVDDDVNVVFDVFFQLRYFVKLIDLAVHAYTRKALRLQVGKKSTNSPLRSRTAGARIITRVSSGSFKTASTI